MAKSNEDELRSVLDATAQDIAGMYDNPRSWQSWIVYMLERLEAKAAGDAGHADAFKEMLSSLQDELRNRLRTGGW